MNSFADFGLLGTLLKSLKEKKFVRPTEIQAKTIPMILGGQPVVGVSETGSGKTLAYALPLLHKLKTLEDEGSPVETPAAPRAVIMVPTRELGEQVAKVFKSLTHDTRLRVRSALGGMSLAQARTNTGSPFEILLATPGRLLQMLDADVIDLSDVRFLIFDEADQMMDQGFLEDSKAVAKSCSSNPQKLLFSATVSPKVQELLNEVFAGAEFIRSAGSGKTVQSLVTKNLMVKDGKRWPLFEKVLSQPVDGGTMVFTNTREQCDKLAKELSDKGYACAVYRGEMDKNDRRLNLKKFRDGKIDMLIATDLAGRGLDIESVARVINFHLPQQMENYIHRVGRTARAGRKGLVVNLVTERDSRLIARLEGKKPAPSHSKNSPRAEAKSESKTPLKGQAKARAREQAIAAELAKTNPAAKSKSKARSKPSPSYRPTSR